MKKLMMMVAVSILAVAANAATVGWGAAGLTDYKSDAYSFFVIGQNGVTDIATVTALLDAGESFDSYAFGSGAVSTTGAINTTAASSGKTLGEGTYTSFFVLFDGDTPTAGSSNYAVISGQTGLTKSIGGSTATVTFTAANVSSYMSTATWKSYGAVPEPTSGLLMLLGMAGLALKRKRA